MLNPELISHNLCTQGFHIIEEFLEVHHYQSLCTTAQTSHQQGLFNNARIGLQIQATHNQVMRSDEIYWLNEQSADPSIQAYLKETSQLANILNQTLFLSLAEFETHFAVYQPGAFYKKHVDQFAAKKTRKISCVYYLNEDWQAQFGGELMLYNTDNQLIKKIYPKGNRFICFNSELPHEVCTTHKMRFSITGWMKTASLELLFN